VEVLKNIFIQENKKIEKKLDYAPTRADRKERLRRKWRDLLGGGGLSGG